MPFLFGKNKTSEEQNKILKFLFIFVFVFLFFFSFSRAFAATRYWVGGTGNWDTTDTTHWSATSGGVGGATVPGSGVDVVFDENSGSGTATITGGTVFAKTLTQTNGTGTLNVSILQSNTLNLYGNVTLLPEKFSVSSSTYQFRYFGSGTFISGGNTLGEFLVQGASVAVVLGDALTVSKVTLTSGMLITGSFTHNWGIFNSSNSNTRFFDGTGSIINITGTTGTVLDFSNSTGLTFNAPSNVSLSSATATRSFNAGGNTFNNVSIASSSFQSQFTGDVAINGALLITAPNIIRITSGKTITMGPSSSIVATGTVGNLIDLDTVSGTGTWTITRPSGTQNFILDYLTLNRSVATQANTFFASNTTNTGTNTNWVFANLPDAPTALTPTAGNTEVSLSWTAGADNGSAITDYVVEYKRTSDSTWSIFADAVSTLTTATVTGLTNSTSYDFRVSAVNAIGQGTASATATTTPYNPNDRYWVGGAGNWSDTAHWANYSGGVGGQSLPTSSNDVYIDENSGSGILTRSAQTSVKSFTMTNGSGTCNMSVDAYTGGFYLYGNMTLLPGKFSISTTIFTEGTGTIISAGNSFNTLYLEGASNITLGDATNISFVYLQVGTLTTGSFTHTWGSFNSNYTSTRNLNISNSTINFSTYINGYTWILNSGTYTLNAVNSTLNFSADRVQFAGNVGVYDNLNFIGTGQVLNGSSLAVNNLNRTVASGDKNGSFLSYGNIAISNNGSLILKGVLDNRYRLLVTSSTLGTRRIFTLGTNTTTDIQRVDFRDIGFASPIDLSGITGGAGDCLGNNNITFNTPRNMYWKTSTSGTKYYSNYNGVNPWYSQTNGGGTNYTDSPLPQDNVFFDASSVGGSTTISLDQPRAGTDINFNGVTNSPTITAAQTWTGYGSLTLTSAMTFSATGQWNLEGRGNHTLNFSTQSLHYGAIYAIGSSSSYTAVSNITAKAIWFNYNVSPSVAGTLNMGSYTWNMTSTNSSSPWFIYSGTINSQTSTLQLSGNTSSTTYVIYDTPGNIVYNNINISGTASSSASWQFNNSFTVNGTFTISAPNKVRVAGGKTITLGPSASLVANGTVGNLIDWNVVSGTTPWGISKASGSIIVDYNSLSYSNATGGAGFYATNTTNGGNNSGWTFVVVPGVPTSPVAIAGAGQASLSWTAPASNGGLPVADYVIEYKLTSGSSWTVFSDGVSTDTSAIVSGLSNGQSYDFRISAVNPAGQGSPSDVVSAMPVTVPDAPTGVSAVAGNRQASVSFTPPAWNGGNAITSYIVTSSPGNITATGNASPIVVSGLTNGTSYTFTVIATNAIGTSIPSSPSNETVPFTIPDAPTGVSAVAGNRQASVSFTPPVFNGGSEITGYAVTSNPGNITATGNASPIVVSGLTSGESYTFTVKAINNAGSGASSLSSNQITLPTEPGAPVNLAGTVLGSSVGLSWSAPISDGGMSIIDYVVEYKLTTGGVWSIFADGVNTNTIATVVGLSNENSYDFRVSAVNEVGTSLPSDIITRIPGEPAQVIIQSISDTTLPNIGADIRITNEGTVSYEYQYTWCVTDSVLNLCGGGNDIFSATAAKLVGVGENWDTTLNSNILVPGNYYFHIKVLYGSDSSNAYQSFTAVATAPDAPTIGTATMGNRQASVSFTPPAWNGGNAITSYIVTSGPGNITATGNASPIVVSGLTNGTSYTFTVIATNTIGGSLPSDSSNAIIPMTIPNPPTGVVAVPGDKQVSLTWVAPLDDGGSSVIDYVIEYKLATDLVWLVFSDGISTNTSAVVSGLVNNLTYNFRISAVNIMGQSLVNTTNITLPADQVNGGGSGYVLPPKPPIVENEISIENEKEIVEKFPEIPNEKEKKLKKKDSKKEKINSNNNNNNLTPKTQKTNEVEATPKENPKITIVPEVLEVKINTQNKTNFYAFMVGAGIVVLGGGVVWFMRRRGQIAVSGNRKNNFSKIINKKKKKI